MSRWLILFLSLPIGFTARSYASSDGFEDILKMSKAGMSEDVMTAYVGSANVAYNPNVDEMLYLSNMGVSQKVIAAMLARGKELRDKGGAPVVASSAPPPLPTPPPDLAPQPAPVPAFNPPPPLAVPADPAPIVVSQQTYDPVVAANAAPPPIPEGGVTVSYFYESMGPHGTWISDPEFGWVWRPNVLDTNPNWRPYVHNGHWVWTDQGWYWHSKYSWGWAPFHYGRWQLSPVAGWVWIPDTVWAPAWVSFRQSDSHFGWAPLPPHTEVDAHLGLLFHGKHVEVGFDFGLSTDHFTFVASNHFLEPSMEKVVVPPAQAAPIYQKTTIINNYTVNNVTNNTTTNNTTNVTNNTNNTTNNTTTNNIVNSGISPAAVAKATNKPVQAVSLTDASTKPGDTAHSGKIANNQLTVFRPAVASSATDTPVTLAQKRPNLVRVDAASAANPSTAPATFKTASGASITPPPAPPAHVTSAVVTTPPSHTTTTPPPLPPAHTTSSTSAAVSTPPASTTANTHTALSTSNPPPSTTTPPPTPPSHPVTTTPLPLTNTTTTNPPPSTTTPPPPPPTHSKLTDDTGSKPPEHKLPPDDPRHGTKDPAKDAAKDAAKADTQARELLADANLELKQGHIPEAKDLLHRIIKLYPQSPSADAARSKLQSLGSK